MMINDPAIFDQEAFNVLANMPEYQLQAFQPPENLWKVCCIKQLLELDQVHIRVVDHRADRAMSSPPGLMSACLHNCKALECSFAHAGHQGGAFTHWWNACETCQTHPSS